LNGIEVHEGVKNKPTLNKYANENKITHRTQGYDLADLAARQQHGESLGHRSWLLLHEGH
jgi:hypothetical protein